MLGAGCSRCCSCTVPVVFIGVVIGVDVVPPVPVFVVVVPLPPLLPVCVEGVLLGRELSVRHCPRCLVQL